VTKLLWFGVWGRDTSAYEANSKGTAWKYKLKEKWFADDLFVDYHPKVQQKHWAEWTIAGG
jgi:hypothetical protein